MKRYDFSAAQKVANERFTPGESSKMLKDAALNLATLIQDDQERVCDMQIAVSNATNFLDMIREKEEKQ